MKMTLKLSELSAISAGIVMLDQGYAHLYKDANGEKATQLPFKIDGQTRMKLKMNLDRIRPIVDNHQKTVKEMINQRAPDTGEIDSKKDPKAYMEFIKEQDDLDNTTYEVDLFKIKSENLKLEDNPIPMLALSRMEPILEMQELKD